MSALSLLLQPLRAAAAAFFKHDVALRREGDSVRLVLEERSSPKQRKLSREEQARRKDKQELIQMRAELAALLNELPDTRRAMRHLAFVEQALAKKGLRALHKIPLDVLQRALEQLEGLVLNWSPEGLANLRSKMAVAVLDREHMDPEAEADAYRTAAVLDAPPAKPEAPSRSDDEALAAAYAALGALAPDGVDLQTEPGILAPAGADLSSEPAMLMPADVELQGELGSQSARKLGKGGARAGAKLPEIQLREVQT